MKRFIIISTLLLLVALGLLGNQIAGRALDSKLAPLLTRALGLPVQLAPIRAHLLTLQAYSDKLVMGDADTPAVTATDLKVGLSWPDILRGELRIVTASATDLMVRPSRWPSSDSPAPTDYDFLEQWLPRDLLLKTGRYTNEDGESYPVQKAHWQRQVSGSASVSWHETRQAGDITLSAQLHSLENLLHLAPLALDLTMEVTGETDSKLALKATVQPGQSSAYSIKADLQAANMSAQIVATGQEAWTLPDDSKTDIPLLKPEQLVALFKHYSAPDTAEDTATKLAATLPRLDLPTHQSHVVISEGRSGDEVTRDISFEVTSSEQGIQVSDLVVNGPIGILTGELGIVSSEQGWQTKLSASVKARADQSNNLMAEFTGANWLWHTGQTIIQGKGSTLGSLLYSQQGKLSLAGEHAGTVRTPINLTAQLTSRPEALTLDQLSIQLGEGHITGSATLSGKAQRKVTLDLEGNNVLLGFMFEGKDAEPLVGMALPEYLAALPSVALDVSLNVTGLDVPGLNLTTATAKLQRTAEGGTFVATGSGDNAGTLKLTITANTPADKPADVKLDIQLSELDLPGMFKHRGLIYSRTSGDLNFSSRGTGMKEIFSAMHGNSKLSVKVRADNDWKRASREYENLALRGDSQFVIDKDRIVGVDLTKITFQSIAQDLTGDLSLVASRNPWLVAKFESKKLDVNGLLNMMPQPADDTQQSDLLQSLRSSGGTQITLDAAAVVIGDIPVTDVTVQIISGIDTFGVKQFDFTAEAGTLQSHGDIAWEKNTAKFDGVVTLSNLSLDQFLIPGGDVHAVPISGSAKLDSEGNNVEDLLSNLTGYIDLKSSTPPQSATPQTRRKLEMKATQIDNGMKADISSFQWGETELSGHVLYYHTTPASLDIEIHGGSISLLPWENAYLNTSEKAAAETKDPSAINHAARTSAKFVGDVLLTPLKFFASDKEHQPGDRIFSQEPLPLDSLKNFDLKLSGHLDSIRSTELSSDDLNVTASLAKGVLDVKASTGKLGGGTGEITLAMDFNATPATAKLDSTFDKVRGLTNENSYPRSGMISIETRGNSEAQLAANTSGLIYLELGKGPFDYHDSALLTTNLSSTVFTSLIPGIEKTEPHIDCGVTVGVFKAGLGATPYGFAARTDEANLLGHVGIDLIQETIQISLDSRGRHGIGLSVGSVFANTILIKGPLNDPAVVPDTTSLIWRGWAAFMTGGLSILGESMFKRVLASDDPCESTKKMIEEDLCPKNPIAAASKMVCPNGS